MNIVPFLSNGRFSIIFSLVGALIFQGWLFLILAVTLNFFYPLQSSFENSMGWYLLLAISFLFVFCALYLLSSLFNRREKLVWSIIFSIFLIGIYFPNIFIRNNKSDFSQGDQKYISQAFREIYRKENPSGVAIRSFKRTSEGYSLHTVEYGFFGIRDGYHIIDAGSSGREEAESGSALKVLPYFLLALSFAIFVTFKIVNIFIKKLHGANRRSKKVKTPK